MFTKLLSKVTIVASRRKRFALKHRRVFKNRLSLFERLEVREMMAADTPSWLKPEIMQKSFDPSNVAAIRAELFTPGNRMPSSGTVFQTPDGKITWEQYPGKSAEPRALSDTQVFVTGSGPGGFVVDLKDQFRVFDGQVGWSSIHSEYSKSGGLPDWVKDNFVAKPGATDIFGNPIKAGNVHILGGVVDLGSPEWPGAGDGGIWWIPDRIGAFDFSPYFVTHDWDFDPKMLSKFVDIVGTELNAFGVGVVSDLTILPLQTIYSGSTTIVGLIKATTNDLNSLVSAIGDAFVTTDTSKVSRLPQSPIDIGQNRPGGPKDPELLNLATYRGDNGEFTTVGFDKNGARVAKQYASDASGGAVLKGTDVVYESKDKDTAVSLYYSGQSTTNPDILVSFNGALVNGEKLGSILGPQLIGMLGIENPFARLAANTVGTTVLGNALELISGLKYSLFNDIPLPEGYKNLSEFLLEKSFGDFTGDLATSFQNQSASTIASLLIAEAAERLNLDGFKGQVFTTTGTTIGSQLANNVADAIINNKALTEAQLLIGFEKIKLLNSIGNALGSLLAAKVGNNLVKIESISEALSSTVAGIYGAANGATIVAGTSIASGFATSAVGSLLGSKLAGALGALIFPGIGAFLGTLVGQTIGSKVFDFVDRISGGFFSGVFAESVYHYQYVNYDAKTNSFIRGAEGSKNTTAQIRTGTYSITDAYLESMNQIVKMIGGRIDEAKYRNASDNTLFAYVGRKAPWDGRDEWRVVFGGGSNYINSGGDTARVLRIGLENQLSKLVFTSGDPLMLKAFEAWQLELPEFKARSGDSLASLMAKLQLAEDVRKYEENVVLINAVLKSKPDSALALSWVATRMQWDGLNAKVADILRGNAQQSDVKVIATVKDNTQKVSLSWTPVATGTAQNVEQWRFASKQWEVIGRLSGSASSFETNQLTPGLKRFRVTTIEGQSSRISALVEVTVPLFSPAGLSAQVKAGTRQVVLGWSAVNGTESIQVRQWRWATSTWDTIGSLSGSATGFTTNTVTPGTKRFRVISTLGTTSATSTSIDVVVTLFAPTALSTQVKAGTQQVVLGWSAVNGAESIQVQQWRWATSTWDTITSLSGSATGFTTNTVTPGTKRFRIVATLGTTSATSTSIDIVVPLFAPVGLSAQVKAGTQQVVLGWSAVNGAESIQVQQWRWATSTWDTISSLSGSATGFTTITVTPGTKRFRVVSTLGSTSASSTSIDAVVPLFAPTGVSAQVRSGTQQVDIAWSAVNGAESIQVQQWRWATSTWDTISSLSGSATGFTTITVTPGTKRFRVISTLGSTSATSTSIDAVVPLFAPTGVSAQVRSGTQQVDIAWSAVNGAEAINVQQWRWATSTWETVGSLSGSATRFTTITLTPGAKRFRIVAILGTTSATSANVDIAVR